MAAKLNKVAFVIPSMGNGGAERVFRDVIINLDSEHFEVHLITLVSDGQNIDSVRHLPNVHIHSIQGGKILNPVAILKMLKLLRREKFTTIISTLMQLNVILGLCKGFVSSKSKWIAREANIPSIYIKSKNYNSLFERLYTKAMNNFDLVIAQSDDMLEDMRDSYGISTQIVKINNPLPIAEPVVYQRVIRDEQCLELVTVGRLSYQKGFERLIRTMAQVKRKFRLRIFGDGPFKADLEKVIAELGLEESVFLMGIERDHDKVYKDADCYLLSSYFEGFPNVLLEALSYGLPCIAFDAKGGINEIINQSFIGRVVNSQEEYAQTVESFERDNYSSEQIQRNGTERFNPKLIYKQYEQVLIN